MVGRSKIAIVGTGIAGNVIAHRLYPDHEITVFEANDYIGGHSNTIDIQTSNGAVALDTGFIVFNNRTYPSFIQLLKRLNVAVQNSSMSFSVQSEADAIEYNGSTLNTLFAQRRNILRPSFHRMIRDILRFNKEASAKLREDDLRMSLVDFLSSGRYSQEFIENYLIPMGAAIWSAKPEVMFDMPARFFVRFFENHGLLSVTNRPTWRVIQGGSREYVSRLVQAHIDRIRLSCPVRRIERNESKVIVHANGCESESFDYVFLACHSDQALAMLADPSRAESDILGSIPYQRNEAILHTDDSLMPARKRAWAAWNYHISTNETRRATLTYHLNRLQGLDGENNYFVTLNSENLIRPDSIIKRITYDHPVFTASSVAAQTKHGVINGMHRTYFCGAYWRYGFHEDGVVSAMNALEHFAERREDAQWHFQRAS